VIGADRITHSDRDCYGWRKRREGRPDVVQEFATDYTFSKTALEIVKHSIDKADAHLTTPKGSGKAEYEYEKKLTTTKSTVTEYLLSKYVVRKATISAEREDLAPNERFEKAVSDALNGQQNRLDGYANLLAVLNVWGYYVPLRFTLGGMVYATDQSEIKDFSEAETEKQTFKASFDAKVGDIGGGGGGEHSTTSTTTTTRNNKYQATQLQQIGGLPGIIGSAKLEPVDARNWAVSLNAAKNWEVVEYARLLPTLCLIKDGSTRATCLNLIRTYRTYPAVLEYQKVIQMADYALAVQGMDDNPYG
jgi:MAC/Perforin domain